MFRVLLPFLDLVPISSGLGLLANEHPCGKIRLHGPVRHRVTPRLALVRRKFDIIIEQQMRNNDLERVSSELAAGTSLRSVTPAWRVGAKAAELVARLVARSLTQLVESQWIKDLGLFP